MHFNSKTFLFAFGIVHNEQMGVTLEGDRREVAYNFGNYMEVFKLKDK